MSKNNQNDSPQTQAFLRWFRASLILLVVGWLGFTVYQNTINPDAENPFKLGLDLAGGSHLVYEADTSELNPADVPELMNVLRNVIDRRINVLGVSEPIIQVERSSFVTDQPIERLVVELPGVTDVSEAIKQIGETPLLEFRLFDEDIALQQETLKNLESMTGSSTDGGAVIGNVSMNGEEISEQDPFVPTGLTGRYLVSANVGFASGQGQLREPLVEIQFDEEGGELFAEITRKNVNKQLGIFLDGELLSAPNINEAITGGRATISGNFTPDEARDLAENLSFGALPMPIKLQSVQTIGATLGSDILDKGIQAAALGLIFVLAFMAFWYRLPGIIAGVSLLSYVVIMLALFQYIPVTLTSAGLAGFILSLGMAVDANVLVFERFLEERKAGASSREAARIGFTRAWSAIRDGNMTSILSAIILFWFGTSMVKGFALVFGVGTIVSMISALLITRSLLMALPDTGREVKGIRSFLIGSGLQK